MNDLKAFLGRFLRLEVRTLRALVVAMREARRARKPPRVVVRYLYRPSKTDLTAIREAKAASEAYREQAQAKAFFKGLESDRLLSLQRARERAGLVRRRRNVHSKLHPPKNPRRPKKTVEA